MSDKMSVYSAVCNTPKEAQKTIPAGRLKGFTDINPMFRIKRLTEVFGPCGTGWYIEPLKRELVDGANGEVKAFIQVALYVRTVSGEWSAPIIGEGGAAYITAERSGIYTDDEAYKKAMTDAIGSACKLLGMSADIYYANDRTKYISTPTATNIAAENATQATDAEELELAKLVNQFSKISGLTQDVIMDTLKRRIGKSHDSASHGDYITYLKKIIKESKK